MANDLSFILKIKDEATKTLQNFTSQLEKTSSVGKSSFANIGKAATVAGLAMTAVGAATIVVSKNAMDMAVRFEQAQIAFQSLTGSIAGGNKLFEELKSFAKVTPFNLVDLQEYTKRLLAMGSTQETVIKELGMMGDMASAVGMEKMPQLILAFGQVRAKTRLSGEELRQFSEAGIPLLQALADQAGVTASQMTDMISDKQIPFDDVKKALEGMTGEGGKFFKMMAMQSTTAGGKISNFQDGIDQLNAALGNALLPTLKSALDFLIPLIDRFTAWASQNQFMITSIVAVGLAIGVLGVAITSVAAIIFLVTSPIMLMASGFVLVGVAIAALVVSFLIWKDEILAFVTGVWEAFTGFFNNLLLSVTTFVTNAWLAFTGFFQGIITAVIEFFTTIYETHKVWFDLIIAIFAFLFNSITWFWQSIFTIISYFVQLIWAGIEIAFTAISAVIMTIFNAIGAFLKTIWEWIYSAIIAPTLEKIKSVVQSGFALVKQYIIQPVTEAFDFFKNKLDAMYEKAASIKESIVNVFRTMAEGITNALRSIKFPHLSIGEGNVSVAGKEIKYPKLNVDWYEKGGWVGNTGLAMVHQGEFVMSKDMLNGNRAIPPSVSNTTNNSQPINVTAIINNELDALSLGNLLGAQLAFASR